MVAARRVELTRESPAKWNRQCELDICLLEQSRDFKCVLCYLIRHVISVTVAVTPVDLVSKITRVFLPSIPSKIVGDLITAAEHTGQPTKYLLYISPYSQWQSKGEFLSSFLAVSIPSSVVQLLARRDATEGLVVFLDKLEEDSMPGRKLIDTNGKKPKMKPV